MKITCDIIQDLLPLYVDQALSADSCILVEEHLERCGACRTMEKQLRSEQDDLGLIKAGGVDDAAAVKTFRKVRRGIRTRIFASVCLTAVLVLAAVRLGYYFYYEKESFIPFEESGLVMRGDQLYTTRTCDGRLESLLSADQKKEFLLERETAEIRKLYPSEACDYMLHDYREMLDPDPEELKKLNKEETKTGIEKVYYVSEDCLDILSKQTEMGWEEWSEEMEKRSILLWDSERGAAQIQSGEQAD